MEKIKVFMATYGKHKKQIRKYKKKSKDHHRDIQVVARKAEIQIDDYLNEKHLDYFNFGDLGEYNDKNKAP